MSYSSLSVTVSLLIVSVAAFFLVVALAFIISIIEHHTENITATLFKLTYIFLRLRILAWLHLLQYNFSRISKKIKEKSLDKQGF